MGDQTEIQLADLWWFEHLLSMPGVSEEVINHYGHLFSCSAGEDATLPSPIAARLFLRHIRNRPSLTEWDLLELLQLLGLIHKLSCKQQNEFRLAVSPSALQPPIELVTEVLLQILCDRADPGSSDEEQPPLTAEAVVEQAHALLQDTELDHLLGDELLQNRLSLLEQLLRGGLEPSHLQQQLRQAFPTDSVEELLREFVDKAVTALGPTTLQLHQEALHNGTQLPADPMMHFAELLPQPTQLALDAPAAPAAGLDLNQQQQLGRSTGPVALLGETTGPVLGPQDVEEQPASPGLKAQVPEGTLQQAAAAATAAAGSPAAAIPARATAAGASPARGAARAAAADAAAEADAPKPRGRGRPPKDVKVEAAAARPSRRQLQLEPTSAPPAQTTAAEVPVGASRQQQPQQASTEGAVTKPAAAGGKSAPAAAAGAEAAAAEAPAAQHKRGRVAAGAARGGAGAAAAAGAGLAEGQQEGAEQHAKDGHAVSQKPGAKGKSIAAGFVEMLSKPLDGIAAAVSGGIAAAVGRSPSASARERKLCGAPQAGVQGKAVAWESPFKSTDGSPPQDPSGRPRAAPERTTGAAAAHVPPPPAAAAAAAEGAAAGRITNALKRKREQGGAHPAAAAAAAAAARADSGATEYQDAREEGASESEGAGGQGQEVRRRRPPPRARARGSEGLGGSEEEGIDDADSDAGSDDETLQQRQNKQQQRGAAAGRSAGRPASSSGGAAAAGAAGGSRRAHVPAGGAGVAAAAASDLFSVDGSDFPRKRRKTVRWSTEEENLLCQLVGQEGEGQWVTILKLGAGAFNPTRTQVDLKDKWRNLKKFKGLK